MIICIVGPSCAGKTTSAKYINRETGVPFIEASDSVERRREENEPKKSLIKFAEERVAEESGATFAKNVADDIDSYSSQNVIVSGFRLYEEVKYIRQEYENVEVFSIYANSLLRFQRKQNRDNLDRKYSYEDFVHKDYREYELGLATLIDSTESVIINEGTFGQLYSKIDDNIIEMIK